MEVSSLTNMEIPDSDRRVRKIFLRILVEKFEIGSWKNEMVAMIMITTKIITKKRIRNEVSNRKNHITSPHKAKIFGH